MKTKYIKSGTPRVSMAALLLLTLIALTTCLNPTGFSPELKLAIDANISGDIDVYNANNAVLWVINRTLSVDVTTHKIEVVGTQPAGYPMYWDDTPRAGSSFASYHRPHQPRDTNDNAPVQPYQYKITVDTRENANGEAPGTTKFFSMVKQMPLPKDYAIFLIRRADGSLDLVDEEPPLDALDPDDTTEPPLPPKPTVPRYPLIVRNVTKSADIESINFGDVDFGNYVYGNMNDQKTFELEAKDYEPTFVSYKLHDGTTGESVHNTVGPRVTVIDKNVTADSASWHLLFLYFYLSTDGTYKITQRWPPEMNDVDSEGNNTGNYDDTRIRVLNTVSATYVTAISLVKNSGAYTVGSDNFIPAGVIGTGFDMNRDSKVAVYEPGGEPGFGPFAGEPYDVVISMVDERYNSSRPGQILVRRKALNLWLGNTHNIKITDSDVNEGGDVVIIPPQPGSYTVTANGGPPAAITANEYQTTQLTFTFDSAPAVLSLTDIQKIDGTTTITSLAKTSDTVYVANVTVTNTEVLQLKVNKSQVTTETKSVQVYKKDDSGNPPLPQTVGRIILYDAAQESSVLASAVIAAAGWGNVTDPSTLTFGKSKLNLFSGLFLKSNKPSVSDLNNQNIANWRVLEIIGTTNAEFVKFDGSKNVTAHYGQTHAGDGTTAAITNIGILTDGSAGSFQLKASIPPEKNGNANVYKIVTVNVN